MLSIGHGLALAISLSAGVAVAVQAPVNAQLGRHLGHPLWASLFQFSLAVVILIVLLTVFRVPFPDITLALKGPWWMWVGGALGLYFVTMALMMAPVLGIGTFLAALVAGQMAASLLIDHFALVGIPERPMSLIRLLGAAAIVFGVVLIQTPRSD